MQRSEEEMNSHSKVRTSEEKSEGAQPLVCCFSLNMHVQLSFGAAILFRKRPDTSVRERTGFIRTEAFYAVGKYPQGACATYKRRAPMTLHPFLFKNDLGPLNSLLDFCLTRKPRRNSKYLKGINSKTDMEFFFFCPGCG